MASTHPRSGYHAHHHGFTLLGTLFAAFFIATVATALASLTVATQRTGRMTTERFIATGLAREGIELARSMRDDNWFAYVPTDPLDTVTCMRWRGGTTTEVCADDVPVSPLKNLCNGMWVIDPELAELRDPSTNGTPNGELFRNSDGVYTHNTSAAPTGYRRTVQVSSAIGGTGDCGELAHGVPSATQPNPTPPDPLLIVSRVAWCMNATSATECGGPGKPWHAVELRTELYPWKRVR